MMVRAPALVALPLLLAACQSGSVSQPSAYRAAAAQPEPVTVAQAAVADADTAPLSLVPEAPAQAGQQAAAPALAASYQPAPATATSRPGLGNADLGELTSGYWRVVSVPGCGLRFGHPGPAGAPVSASGCGTAPIGGASSWAASGESLRLLDAAGAQVATLFIDRPDLLTGHTAFGEEIVLSK